MSRFTEFAESIPARVAQEATARIAVLLGKDAEWDSDNLSQIAEILRNLLPDTTPSVSDQNLTEHAFWARLAADLGWESDFIVPEVGSSLTAQLIEAAAEGWSGGDIPDDWRTDEYARGQIELILNTGPALLFLPGEIKVDDMDAEARKDFVWLLVVACATMPYSATIGGPS